MTSRKLQLSAFTLMIVGVCAHTALAQSAGHPQSEGQRKIEASRSEFRVCADPNNLPFTDRAEQGFENQIAELMADAAHQPLVYYWWPDRPGFINDTLNAWECDVVNGVPPHDDLMRTTQPYYCSRYVMVHRAEQSISPSFLDSQEARALRMGVVERTPPLDLLLRHGLRPVIYFTNYDYRNNNPGQIVKDVATRKIDAALVWGPVGGFFVRHQTVPLQITTLEEGSDGPQLTFPISFGVRRADKERSAFIGTLIRQHAADIQTILKKNGVPTVDDPIHCPTLLQPARVEQVTPVRPFVRSVAQTVDSTASDRNSRPRPNAAEQQVAEAQSPAQPSALASGAAPCNGTETMADIQKLVGGLTINASASDPPYTAQEGKVDAKTYSGWIRYSAFCQQCHGIGGIGSGIAPDLTQAVKDLNKRQFETIVSCGLKGNLGTGVMPAWGDNPNIKPYLDNLWAYLSARAHGVLGAGRPQKLGASN
jgi:mxaJ protein